MANAQHLQPKLIIIKSGIGCSTNWTINTLNAGIHINYEHSRTHDSEPRPRREDAMRKKKTKNGINVIYHRLLSCECVCVCVRCELSRFRTSHFLWGCEQYEYFIYAGFCVMFNVHAKQTHYWLFEIFTIFSFENERMNVLLLRIVQMPTCIGLTASLCVCAFKRPMRRDILSLLSIVYHNC